MTQAFGFKSTTDEVLEVDDSNGVHGGVRSYARDPERAKALRAKGEELASEHFYPK